MINRETIYTQDLAKKKIKVVREFDAPVEQVWKAWTEPKLLDQWWAPRPWKAVTQSMDFRAGGTWRYYMQGPEGEKHYCKFDYETITPNKSYTGIDGFVDENGNDTHDLPNMRWLVSFIPSGNTTKTEIDITFENEADLNKIIEMGFKEGFAAAHTNLDELLAK